MARTSICASGCRFRVSCATRGVALHGQPRYFVMYEVEQLATLTSDAYLARLNDPSPGSWTRFASFRRGQALAAFISWKARSRRK